MTKRGNSLKRGLWASAGLLALGLGFVGIVVPVLPTTPFLLLAAYCFLRSSARLHTWLLTHRLFGPYIRAYQEHKAIPASTRRIALLVLWLSLILSGILVQKAWVWGLLGVIGLGVSLHLLTLRALTPKEYQALSQKAPSEETK